MSISLVNGLFDFVCVREEIRVQFLLNVQRANTFIHFSTIYRKPSFIKLWFKSERPNTKKEKDTKKRSSKEERSNILSEKSD